jgi:hypothetical protein
MRIPLQLKPGIAYFNRRLVSCIFWSPVGRVFMISSMSCLLKDGSQQRAKDSGGVSCLVQIEHQVLLLTPEHACPVAYVILLS